MDSINLNFCYIFQIDNKEGLTMDDSLLFFTGLFCFVLAIVGVVMTILEFKNIELKNKK